MFHEWHPTVVHDLHEGSPLMLTWNGTGPYNPNIDSITYDEFLEMSFHEVQAMTAAGMPGVSTWNFGEAFSHLYLDSVAMNHNAIGRGYETWGNGSAETMRRSVSRLSPEAESGIDLEPPPAGTDLVGARQPELSGDRRDCRARLRGALCQGDAPQLLPERVELLAEGADAAALRVSPSPRIRATARGRRRWSNVSWDSASK